MDEEQSSKLSNLPEMFRNSHHARKIIQTTQPIFEEFSTNLRTVGFSNETEVTYATSFFSQVGFFEYNCWSIVTKLVWITFTINIPATPVDEWAFPRISHKYHINIFSEILTKSSKYHKTFSIWKNPLNIAYVVEKIHRF